MLSARIAELTAKAEEMAECLKESQIFWTIAEFNGHFLLNWDSETCRLNERMASAYSRQHGYDVRKNHAENAYAFDVLYKLFLS
jgi:hypothetical protein